MAIAFCSLQPSFSTRVLPRSSTASSLPYLYQRNRSWVSSPFGPESEVKDILYHLYKTPVGNLQRLMPKEIRILKYLLIIEDPEEQMSTLKDAFTPGQELEGKDVDCLYTTPQELHTWMRTVVDAYHFSREGTLIKEARDLMTPKVIHRLEHLKKLVETNFL